VTLEHKLAAIAECHLSDKVSSFAMRLLRNLFDPTYFWCNDCDGMVVKEDECCLKQK